MQSSSPCNKILNHFGYLQIAQEWPGEGNGNPLQYSWAIPWTKEPGRLQSMGSLRVRHDWATSLSLFTFMHWRRKWQPTPVFLPGESRDRGAWWATVSVVAQSQTQLKRLSKSSRSDLLSDGQWTKVRVETLWNTGIPNPTGGNGGNSIASTCGQRAWLHFTHLDKSTDTSIRKYFKNWPLVGLPWWSNV